MRIIDESGRCAGRAPSRRTAPWLGISAAILLSLGSCARPSGADPEGVSGVSPAQECPAPLVALRVSPSAAEELFSNSSRIIAAVAVSDGGVLMSFDPEVPEAGDESAPEGRPRLVILSASGELKVVPLPELDGEPIAPSVLPLATDSSGASLLYDDVHGRLVSLDQAGAWRVVVRLDATLLAPRPAIAFSPDGEVFLTLATQVVRVDVDQGTVTPVAGRDARRVQDIPFPEPSPDNLDGQPVDVAALPLLTGIAIAPDGLTYLSSQQGAYMIREDGTLSTLLSVTGSGALEASPDGGEPQPQSLFTGIGVSSTGQIILMDTGQQRLLAMYSSSFEEVVSGVSSLNGPAALEGEKAVLVGRGGGAGLCNYEG